MDERVERVERVERADERPRSADAERPTAVRRRTVRRAVTPEPAAPIGLAGGPVEPALVTRIQASRGIPIEGPVRADMERAFGGGADFGSVRVHRSEVAPALTARAFTLGRDIHFAPGEYHPTSSSGRELLAHELSHVVQQDGGGRVQRAVTVGRADDPAEREADVLALRVVARLARPAEAADDDPAIRRRPAAIRRRVDVAALQGQLANAGSAAVAGPQINAAVVIPLNELLLTVTKQVRVAFMNRLTPFLNAVKQALTAPAFVIVNVDAAAAALAREANDVENEIRLDVRNVPSLALQADAQQQLVATNARHGMTHEAVTTLGTAPRATALANARVAANTAANAPAYNAETARATILDYHDLLDKEEHDTSPEHLMKVGTEITFTHATIEELNTINKGIPWDAGINFLNRWAGLVPKTEVKATEATVYPPGVAWGPLTQKKDREAKTKVKDSDRERSPRFTYALASGATWWWQINVDYGCLELQTDPATPALLTGSGDTPDARAVKAILEYHVFKLATGIGGIGLRTDDRIGGGHITLDRTTTFGDNARWLRNFLVLYANEADTWRREDRDKFNAPLLADLKPAGRKAFRDLIFKFDHQAMDANALAGELATSVYDKKFLPDPENDEETDANPHRLSQPTHYQSVNVENWDQPNAPTEQRLEMRRFDAQASVKDLAANLASLGDLLTRARAPGIIVLNLV